MTTITYINGMEQDAISVMDRGLLYGDGLFETILACSGSMPLWQYHYQRLASGCRQLSIPVPEENALLDLIEPHLNPDTHQIIKIIVTRGQAARGYRTITQQTPNVVINISNRDFRSPTYWRDGVAVFCCATRLARQPALAGIKHLNRLEQVMASHEWNDNYQEGLMCTADNQVIEATSHNLFFVKDGRILTADLSEAGVAGVMRQYVIDLASKMQLQVYSQNIPFIDIPHMDEVFLTNSINGVWPVVRVGEWSFKCGAITRNLQARVAEVIPYQ